jgi:MazG family protein
MKRLLDVMARLRDPSRGCPWDRQQTYQSLVPYTLEEAYEVVDAIERGNLVDLKEELGDLLLQVVFYARLAEEQSAFDFEAVVTAIVDKMIRRHPHVFAGETETDSKALSRRWEDIKADEKKNRAARSEGESRASRLDGIPPQLPALARATKVGGRAARMGFDWPDHQGARSKVTEELTELDEAIANGHADAINHEVGDLLLATVSLSRHLGVDPESALRAANRRFETRFRHVEAAVDAGLATSLDDMERYWAMAKRLERESL